MYDLLIMDARSPDSQCIELDLYNPDDPTSTVVTITLTIGDLEHLIEEAISHEQR